MALTMAIPLLPCSSPLRTAAPFQLSLHLSQSQSQKLLYYWRFTANQFVLAPSPLSLMTRDFFNCTFAVIYVTVSLTRRWGCLNEYAWPFIKCTYRTYSMLLKILQSQSRNYFTTGGLPPMSSSW
jgi:GR25 family glycosyltransferase involved in LPS biosynthesis